MARLFRLRLSTQPARHSANVFGDLSTVPTKRGKRKGLPSSTIYLSKNRSPMDAAVCHPDYRFICQEMWRRIQEVHPALANCGKFIDWKKYRLGRLQSEMRTEFKREGMQKGE